MNLFIQNVDLNDLNRMISQQELAINRFKKLLRSKKLVDLYPMKTKSEAQELIIMLKYLEETKSLLKRIEDAYVPKTVITSETLDTW